MRYHLIALVTLFLLLFTVSCKTAESAQDPQQGMDTLSPDELFAHQNSKVWSYHGEEDGSEQWGSINPKWRKCNIGKQQSPINIVNAKPQDLSTLEYHYASMPLRMRMVNGMLKIYPNGEQYISYREKQYGLQYILIHTPAEHHIFGREYAMEIQFYHQSDTSDKWMVISVLVEEGSENSELPWIAENIPGKNEKNNPEGVAIDPSLLIPHAQSTESPHYTDDFYQYNGSQTSPPCSEGVLWFIMATALKASPAQVAQFTTKIPRSARPIVTQAHTVYQGHGVVDLMALKLKERQEESEGESEEEEMEEE
ncbi:carbonic anhydrase family protein [bacterium]|nr:carbonic anhydrase family protein [bacterium]